MKIISKVINAVVLYLSMLSIRSEKIWVFGAWAGMKFSDNSKYMYLHMQHDQQIKSIWISKREDIVDELRKKGLEAYLYKSLKGIWYQLRAKYVFFCVAVTDVNEYLVGNAYLINLMHGIGGKKSGYADKINKNNPFHNESLSIKSRKIARRKSFYVSTAYSYDNVIEETFRANQHQIIHAGFTRNDVFFRHFDNDTSISYKTNKKYILYLPTHRQEGRVKFCLEKVFDFAKLNELLVKYDCQLVIKKHFYHNNEGKEAEEFSNIIDLTGTDYDTQLLMKNSNMLITDYSSCYVDYLLTEKPIGFYCFDLEEYQKNDRELVFKYEDSTPGFKAFSFEELYDQLNEFLAYQADEYALERVNMKSKFFDQYACREASPLIEQKIKTGALKEAYKYKLNTVI